MIRRLLVAAAIAAAAAPAVATGLATSPVTFTADCPGGYENVNGTCVPGPTQAPTPPPGAT